MLYQTLLIEVVKGTMNEEQVAEVLTRLDDDAITRIYLGLVNILDEVFLATATNDEAGEDLIPFILEMYFPSKLD